MAINRVEKLIINMDTAMPITCNWDDCSKRARTSHQVRLHEHMPMKCSWVDAAGGAYGRHMIMAFCSDNCLDYWVAATGGNAHVTASYHQGRIYGNHSAGMRRSLT